MNTGDYGSGRGGNSLDRSQYNQPLRRSSAALGSRSSVDRYSTNSLGKGGYASDYGGMSMSMSSSYGGGYNSRYVQCYVYAITMSGWVTSLNRAGYILGKK